MHIYEIRLLDAQGSTTLVYFQHCANEGDARERVNSLREVSYDRYELWDGQQKVSEGPRLAAV